METERVVCEMKQQLKLAGPLIMTNVLQFMLEMISVMFVGHLGELALSGASYWFNVPLLLAVYVRFSPLCKTTWTGFSREAFQDILLCAKQAEASDRAEGGGHGGTRESKLPKMAHKHD